MVYTYMGEIVNFSMTENLITGTGIGLTAGLLGGAIYNGIQTNKSYTPNERTKLVRLGNKFNAAHEDFVNANKPGLLFTQVENTPEGKRFADAGNKFIKYNEDINKKYSRPIIPLATAATGGILGAGIAYRLSTRR